MSEPDDKTMNLTLTERELVATAAAVAESAEKHPEMRDLLKPLGEKLIAAARR